MRRNGRDVLVMLFCSNITIPRPSCNAPIRMNNGVKRHKVGVSRTILMHEERFFVFCFSTQFAILDAMRLAPIVSILVMSLALNAQTIQGKVVRVSDGDTSTILDEGKVENKVRLNRIDAPEEGLALEDVGINLTPNGPSGCHNVDAIR